jgi:hypothetical protein
MYDLKEMVKDGRKVNFVRYKNSELWYVTETGFEFPVPTADIGDGVFLAQDKAILFMRYIKPQIKLVAEARAEQSI